MRDRTNTRSSYASLLLLLLLALLCALLFSWWFLRDSDSASPHKTFTRAQLWRYRGESGGAVYLAVKGHVFDVTRGRQHYGPGGGYSAFAGRDASRAFADMCFKEECMKVAHVTKEGSMSKEQQEAVEHWLDFYKKEKLPDGTLKYPFVGMVVDDDEYDASKPWFAAVKANDKAAANH